MTADEQARELSATLDREVEAAKKRKIDADENLRLAQAECEAAGKAEVVIQRKRDRHRLTFAEELGIEVEPEPAAEPEPEVALKVEVPEVTEAPRHSLQLVPPAKRMKKPKSDLSQLTQTEQIKHVMGNRTMSLAEIRDALSAAKLNIKDVSGVLGKSKYIETDADGQPRRDPKTDELIKHNVFVSQERGVWTVAEPLPTDDTVDPEEQALASQNVISSRTELQREMLANSNGRAAARRQ